MALTSGGRRAVEGIQDNIGIQARAEFPTLHGAPNDLRGNLPMGLNPAGADCLVQIFVGFAPCRVTV